MERVGWQSILAGAESRLIKWSNTKGREKSESSTGSTIPSKPEAPKKQKLLNKEREALKELPKRIEEMEAERDRIFASMQKADYYRNAQNDPLGDQQKLELLENEIFKSWETWEGLTELS